MLGGASCLEGDVLAARRLVDPVDCIVIAANDAGFWWPGRLDHWVTMHAEELPGREAVRADRGYPSGYLRWTRPYPFGMHDRHGFVDHLITGWSGSSGLLAVGVALEKAGAERVMLCGVPLDERPHFNRSGPWDACTKHRGCWVELERKIQGRVRSFSGWTAAWLGVPDIEWLDRRTVEPYHSST